MLHLRKSGLLRRLAAFTAVLAAVFSLTACSGGEMIDAALTTLDTVLSAQEESSSPVSPAPPDSSASASSAPDIPDTPDPPDTPDEDGWYSSKDEVALYLHTFGKLPGNYLTKKEAAALGWDAQKGNLWEVADGMSIGGDSFGNREGLLPAAGGRRWFECDVNYQGGYRGAERILFSSDGLIYYTDDHYQSFTQLY